MKKSMVNLGPQHPAVHGVLRVILEMNNENVVKCLPEIGYLHRGTEKLFEYNEYYKLLPFFDRFDYVGLILCENSYVLAIEKLLGNANDLYSQFWRSCLNEIMRIASHLLALTTSAMDIGAISPFLWAFEEREEIYTLFENISGARMHTAMYGAGGLNFGVRSDDILYIKELVNRIKVKTNETFELLTNSTIWFNRMQNVGIVDKFISNSYGLTGPIARSCGLNYDVRFLNPYELSKFVPIKIITGSQGDNLTRFFLRLEEIQISIQYIEYLISLTLNTLIDKNTNFQNNKKIRKYFNYKFTMEDVIYKFKSFSEGYNIHKSKCYSKVESPRGEFGISLISWNKILDRPLRLKVRSPGFYNLSSLNITCTNYILSDLLCHL